MSFTTVTIRADARTAAFARLIGNDGVVVALQITLLLMEAEDKSEGNPTACFASLLEARFLQDVIDDLILAKQALAVEAHRINMRPAK
jgi:hypothetical protein